MAATTVVRDDVPAREGGTAPTVPLHRHPVVIAAAVLVVVQLAFRSWALLGGWFYADDFEFLGDATGTDLTLDFLLTPHDSQLMPGGVLASWLVARSGPFDWGAAAAVVLVLQLLANLACWHVLVRLFGLRARCLPLLALYLFSPMTLPAFMWWSAAVNAVPVQLAFFLAVAAHVTYLRTGRLRHAVGAVLAICLGLAFFVKGVLVLAPLVLLTLGWFTDRSTSWPRRVREAAVRYRWAWLLYGAVVAAYSVVYLRLAPNPVATDAPIPYGDVADAMLRFSFGPALLGGPWEWSIANPPLGLVATPAWAANLAWVLLVVVVVVVARSRPVRWFALLIVAVQLATAYVLLARGRGGAAGGFAGLELRYLADSLPVVVLALGLWLLPLTDGRPAERRGPVVLQVPRWSAKGWLAVALTLAVLGGSAVSSVRYAAFWRDDFPAKGYTETVLGESGRQPLLVVDVPVPELVMPAVTYPSNLPSRLFAHLGEDRVRAVTSGNDLDMLSGFGQPFPAVVSPGATSSPGPLADCGYAVGAEATQIALQGAPQDYFWWLQVSYLAGADGTLVVEVGGDRHELAVRAGAHRLFLQGEGGTADLALRTTEAATVLCVDQVTVGDIRPLEPQ